MALLNILLVKKLLFLFWQKGYKVEDVMGVTLYQAASMDLYDLVDKSGLNLLPVYLTSLIETYRISCPISPERCINLF